MNATARTTLALASGALALALATAPASAKAPNKAPDYHWEASSGAGAGDVDISVLGWAQSSADNDDAESEGTQAAAGGPLGGATCPAPDDDNANGNARSSDDGSSVEAIPGVRVLGSSCEANSVKGNRAKASSESSLLSADVGDIEIHVLATSSDSQATSGQSHSSSSVTVASVGGHVVAGCESTSHSNESGTTASERMTILDTTVGDDCPVASAESSGDAEQPSEQQ